MTNPERICDSLHLELITVMINQFTYPGSPYTFTSANPAYNTTYADALSQLGSLQVLGLK
jgi:hypothetical protein